MLNELIQVTTNEQGLSVVSARQLHEFLEVRSKFADWIKNRIIKYGFQEERDYVTVSKNLETGGWEHDYAITLDMAKELAMLERNEKGKQARQYFIDCEKQLRQVLATPAPTTSSVTEQAIIQLLSQSNQLLANQQQLLTNQQQALATLRADVDSIMSGNRPTRKTKPTPRLIGPPTKATHSLRQLVTQRVNQYCDFYNVSQSDTYNYLYKQLFRVWAINVYQMKRQPGESYLDALERYGHLNRLCSLIDAELNYSENE